jgi:hypothetical protein
MSELTEHLIGKWWNVEPMPTTRIRFWGDNFVSIARSLIKPNQPETKNHIEIFQCRYQVNGGIITIETIHRYKIYVDRAANKNTVMEKDEEPFFPFWESTAIFATPISLTINVQEDMLTIDNKRFQRSNDEVLIEYELPFNEY